MDNFEVDAIRDDDQIRASLNEKYKDIEEKYKAEVEEFKWEQKRNSELSDELLQLEQLVFQQKSEAVDNAITPQDTLFDFMKYNEMVNPIKVQMEHFKKLVDLTSETQARITKDYKLNPENSLDLLISETETLQQTLDELNGIIVVNKIKQEDLENELINVRYQFDKDVADYKLIIDENNNALKSYQKKYEDLLSECEEKENELARLKDYLNNLRNDAKSMEDQCELWKQSSID